MSGKERRRLELYDNEKQALLYKNLISDDGTGKVAVMMRDLHFRAACAIAEEESRLKKHLAVAEAAKSKRAALIAINRKQTMTEEMDKSPSKSPGLSPKKMDSVTTVKSGISPTSPRPRKKKTNKTTSSLPSTDSEKTDSAHSEYEQTDDPIVRKMQTNNDNMVWAIDDGAPKTVNDLPEIVSDNNTFHLSELCNSDFIMAVTDRDFHLSHEQLIKAVKCMLYKMNLTDKKN